MDLNGLKTLWERVKRGLKLAAKELKNRDVWKRALKTAWQAAIPAFAIPAAGASLKTWISVVIVAGSAGASAAWNGVLKPLFGEIIKGSDPAPTGP